MKKLMEKIIELIKTRDYRIILGLILFLALLWGVFGWLYYTKIGPRSVVVSPIETSKAIAPADYFDQLDLQATAYVIYNADTGQIIAAENEQAILSLASITKVMTALALLEAVDRRHQVYIGNIDFGGGGNVGGLIPGESWQTKNLLALTLVGSSNYGAEALEGATNVPLVELMNRQARTLELPTLTFTNTTGLDDGPEPGGRGSALDVARLFSYILKNRPELLIATKEVFVRETSLDNFEHTVVNTNKIVNRIPGLMASKTGYTQIAGGNLAVAANLGLRRPIVFVVLGSSIEGRFTDTEKLIDATLAYYADFNQ